MPYPSYLFLSGPDIQEGRSNHISAIINEDKAKTKPLKKNGPNAFSYKSYYHFCVEILKHFNYFDGSLFILEWNRVTD